MILKMRLNEIRNKYMNIVKDKFLGGSEALEELSYDILKLLETSPRKYKIPLFVLHEIFWEIAHDQERRMVTLDEAKMLYLELHKPILDLIDALVNNADEKTLLEITTSLIEKFYETFHQKS